MSKTENVDLLIVGSHSLCSIATYYASKAGLKVAQLTLSHPLETLRGSSGQIIDWESGFQDESKLLKKIFKGNVSFRSSRFSLIEKEERRIVDLEKMKELGHLPWQKLEESFFSKAHDFILNPSWFHIFISPHSYESEFESSVKKLKLDPSVLKAIRVMTGKASLFNSVLAFARGGFLGQSFEGSRTQFAEKNKSLGARVEESELKKMIFAADETWHATSLEGREIIAKNMFCIAHSKELRQLGLKIKNPKPTGWRFTLALTLNKEAIPPGIERFSVVLEDDSPSIEIEIRYPEEYRESLRGDSVFLFARTIFPYTTETLTSAYQTKMASRLFRKLKDLVPFIDFHVVGMYPDVRDPLILEARDVYTFAKLEEIPVDLLVFEPTRKRFGVVRKKDSLFLSSEDLFDLGNSLKGLSFFLRYLSKNCLKTPALRQALVDALKE